MTGARFDTLVRETTRLLPGKIRREVVRESLLHLVGGRLSEEVLDENAWRLAGNLVRLRADHVVPPWNRQVDDEYVPVQVMSVERNYSHRYAAVDIEFQILAGTSCPATIRKTWTVKFCAVVASRLGFSKPWGDYPFKDARELVNMRMYVLIERKLCGVIPDFETIWHDLDDKKVYPPSCFSYNRKWLKRRRRDGFRCPKKYPVTKPCHLCHVGQDACLAAVHDLSFTRKRCPRCKKQGWFDPTYPSRRLCLTCHEESQTRKQ